MPHSCADLSNLIGQYRVAMEFSYTLYIRKRTTSLQWTKWLVPRCPLFRGSTVHKEEDNLSIVDKMAGPKVSFIQRFHCTYGRGQPLYSGQNGQSQCVLYSEVPLYIRKRTTSLQWTKWLVLHSEVPLYISTQL